MSTRFFAARVISFVLLLSLAGGIYGQTGSTRRQPGVANSRPATVPAALPGAVTSATVKNDFAEALSVIEDNYIDGKKLDYNTVFKSSINSMLNGLDPHSNYFDPIENAAFRNEQRSEYFGIGATIGDLREGNNVDTYIRATFENAPAARAGLRYGDRITAIDGQSMAGKTYVEVRKFLLGPRGTVVKVTVEHAANKQTETVTITRDAVSVPSIPQAYLVRPGVGYVAMTSSFSQTTANEFEAALADLHSQGMKMLILDLRGNRGGLLFQAVRVANEFLQKGEVIVTQKGRIPGATEPSYRAINETPDQIPLVVLVNSESASAAEIVAGALQDHDRALIVGENTFGKGLVQLPIQLEHDSALLLTVAKYFTPSGRLIQRDYSNGGFYDYYTRGGIAADRGAAPAQPAGPESRTDTGRTVYGGGGITPDEFVKPAPFKPSENRLANSIFGFALELAAGGVTGFENYRVTKSIDYDRDVAPSEFPVTDVLFKEFQRFVAAKPGLKVTPEQLEKARPFVERQLRFELATAAYGSLASVQVLYENDPQIARAVEAMPRARELALSARRARARS